MDRFTAQVCVSRDHTFSQSDAKYKPAVEQNNNPTFLMPYTFASPTQD